MLMVTHGTIGALIGEHTHSITLAFFIGLILHFLLDIIPHGDRHDVEELKKNPELKKNTFIIMAFDAFFGIGFLLFYFTLSVTNNSEHIPTAIAAITGSVIPDVLVGLHYLNKKLFFRLNYLHLKVHELIKYHIPQRLAIPLQIVIMLFLISLYKFK